MLIDDDPSWRDLLGMALRDRGYDVIECSDGRDALQRLRSARPDVIVLDLHMPVMDGWQFRLEQKRDPSLATIPVLALSANGTPQAAAIDAQVYLPKPADCDRVSSAVERLSLEVERRELEAHIAQVGRLSSLGTLAAGMAHEINNPLAYILLNLTWLEEEIPRLLADRSDPKARDERRRRVAEALDGTRGGAERIRDIVNGLRTFARPDVETVGPVNVRSVVEGAIDMVAHEIHCRARLTKTFHSELPAVAGNAARLGQVFLNLLMNAAQALPEGEADRQAIDVVGTVRDGRVVVEVRDTGAGIAPEVRGRLFEPFFTTKPVGTGTGLGLAICHGIIRAHGGTITVESELGKGSSFRVELPASPGAPTSNAPPRPEL